MAEPPSAQAQALADTLHAQTEAAGTSVVLSEKEERILRLLAEQEELRLEMAVIKAQHALSPPPPTASPPTAAHLSTLQSSLLDARAAYLLRAKTAETVVLADPVLKAVHLPPTSTQLERRLHTPLTSLTALSAQHTLLRAALSTTHAATADLTSRLISLHAQNRALAAKLVALTAALQSAALPPPLARGPRDEGAEGGEVEREDEDEDEDEEDEDEEGEGEGRGGGWGREARKRIDAADREVAGVRRDWRVWKGVAAGVVVGSGVDWAGEEDLVELVVDAEGEEL